MSYIFLLRWNFGSRTQNKTRPFRRENLSYTCHPGVNLLIRGGNESISLPYRFATFSLSFCIHIHSATLPSRLFLPPAHRWRHIHCWALRQKKRQGLGSGRRGGEGINSARWVVAQCADLKVECEAPDGNRTRFETLSFVSSTPVLDLLQYCFLLLWAERSLFFCISGTKWCGEFCSGIAELMVSKE